MQFLSEHHERSLELMAEAAKLEKGPSVMVPTSRGIVTSYIVTLDLYNYMNYEIYQ